MFGCDGMFNSPTSQSVKGCLCAGGKDLREAMRERKETNKNRKGRKERVANDGLGPHQTNYKNAHTHTGKNKEEQEEQEEARKTANKKKQKKKKQEEEEEEKLPRFLLGFLAVQFLGGGDASFVCVCFVSCENLCPESSTSNFWRDRVSGHSGE